MNICSLLSFIIIILYAGQSNIKQTPNNVIARENFEFIVVEDWK